MCKISASRYNRECELAGFLSSAGPLPALLSLGGSNEVSFLAAGKSEEVNKLAGQATGFL